VRHCPACDAQFPDEQEQCLHCGASLAGDATVGLVLLASLDPFESRALLERLAESEIEFSVLNDRDARARTAGRGRPGSFAGVNIFVHPDEHARAFALQQQLVRESLPDLPEDFTTEAADSETCPACASPLAADARSCAECGLEFPDANG
jgi:RNA polymerase subunit RPABC4/transcription elongation factor Spt4